MLDGSPVLPTSQLCSRPGTQYDHPQGDFHIRQPASAPRVVLAPVVVVCVIGDPSGERKRERMVTATTSNPDLDVYTDRDGRRYVVDSRLPPGDMQYVTRVKPLQGLRLWVEFRDGTSGVADLSEIAAESHLAADLWSDREYFETVHTLDDGAGVSWQDERYDMSPLVVYMLVTGKPLDEVCPQVRYID